MEGPAHPPPPSGPSWQKVWVKAMGNPLLPEALRNFDYTKPQLQVSGGRVLLWIAASPKRMRIARPRNVRGWKIEEERRWRWARSPTDQQNAGEIPPRGSR